MDSRYIQVRELIEEAQKILGEIRDEGGHAPVDLARIQKVSQRLHEGLGALSWLTTTNKTNWTRTQ